MIIMKISTRIIIVVSLIIATAGGLGVWHFYVGDQRPFDSAQGRPATSDQQPLYTCPMHPQYISDRPGECPICGMTLVPMQREEGAREPVTEGLTGHLEGLSSVTISPDRQQLIGVKKARVNLGPAIKTMRTVGKVAFDPELAVAQREYIGAKRSGDGSLAEAARQRLTLMGMSAEEIRELGRKGEVQRSLYLPDKSAWVYSVVYESELPFVAIGQSVKIELPTGTGVREGAIRAIDPVLDQTTRTTRLRIEVQNEDGALRPNMFVNATIVEDIGERLLVSKDAVIDSGQRRIVFVVHEGMHFMPVEVKLGAELSDYYVVESGLSEGDEVATAANFLIDAESKLKAALGQMAEHKHGD